MAKKKLGPFAFDPIDAVGAVVSGDIFKDIFDGEDESETVSNDNGNGSGAVDESGESVRPVKRSNPFKPASSAKKKGEASTAKGRAGEHSADPDESGEDESDDGAAGE